MRNTSTYILFTKAILFTDVVNIVIYRLHSMCHQTRSTFPWIINYLAKFWSLLHLDVTDPQMEGTIKKSVKFEEYSFEHWQTARRLFQAVVQTVLWDSLLQVWYNSPESSPLSVFWVLSFSLQVYLLLQPNPFHLFFAFLCSPKSSSFPFRLKENHTKYAHKIWTNSYSPQIIRHSFI